uniref:Putative tumor necrosis factor-mediated signaling pathway n=1 Tax=Amblyomma sculptum TaxID=1581419 RepID=A0A1E1XNL2_AMBSC
MMVQRLRVKDGVGSFGEELVLFLTPVPETILCAECTSLAEEMRIDSKGHMFCNPCLRKLDKGGRFRCRRDGATEMIQKMTPCNTSYRKVLEFEVKCPKEISGCRFRGKLRELKDHLPSCKPRKMKVCTQCFNVLGDESLAAHVQDSCPKRVISCKYCHQGIEAWKINVHLQQCDSRPAVCEYCKKTIESFIKLKNDHLPTCPAVPMACSFKELGCKFMGTKARYEEHMKSENHMELLAKAITELKNPLQQNKILSAEVTDLKRRLNALQESQVSAFKKQQKSDERIRSLEAENAALRQPLVNLLDEISQLK